MFRRPVVDKNRLKGDFDFDVDIAKAMAAAVEESGAPPMNAGIYEATVEDQLGLKLVSQKSPTDVLVIDHAEKPSEN